MIKAICSWSFSAAQSSLEESQLCCLSLHSYTWQLLTPGWVNIPGLTSMFISVKSELLRNEDETPAQSALALCPGFDSSWWKFSACTRIASPVFMMALGIHRALSESSLAGCDSSKKALGRFWPSIRQGNELLWLVCGCSRGGVCADLHCSSRLPRVAGLCRWVIAAGPGSAQLQCQCSLGLRALWREKAEWLQTHLHSLVFLATTWCFNAVVPRLPGT